VREEASACFRSQFPNGIRISHPGPYGTKLTLGEVPISTRAPRTFLQLDGGPLPEITVLLGGLDHRRMIACACPYCLGHSFVNRHRAADPARPFMPRPVVMDDYKNCLGLVYRMVYDVNPNLEPKLLRQVPLAYSGAKRLAAFKTVERMEREEGLCGRFSFDPFVKNEKADIWLVWSKVLSCFTPSARPRAIVPQIIWHPDGHKSNAPILEELRWGSPLEHCLEQMRNTDGSRMFASGRTLDQRAEDLTAMFRPGCVALSIDLSSFDGSQGHLAVAERAAFLEFWRKKGCDVAQLEKVLKAQNVISFGSEALRGKIYGNRASGTGRTSSGNKVVMMAALFHAFRCADDVTFYCDGDDTIIFIPKRRLGRRIRNFLARMVGLGLETKIEGTAQCPEEIVFCRAKIVELPGGPKLVKKPLAAFCSMTAVTKHFKGPEMYEYLSSVATSYKHVYAGVPILGKLHCMYPCDRGIKLSLLDQWDQDFYRKNSVGQEVPEVADSTRLSFARAFGITPELQIEIESLLSGMLKTSPAAFKNAVRFTRGSL